MAEKQQSGRPAKADRNRRTRYLQVRVTDPEKQAFDAAAELAGQELSVWVRQRLRSHAQRELENAGQKVPFIPGKVQ